jgi:flagellar basal-body rod protein FlgG
MRSLDIAATGVQAQQAHVDVISNNLANMTTIGFKRQRAEFQDLIYENQRRVGTNSSDANTIIPTGTQFGLGVKTAGVYRSHNQGTVTLTENALDIAIQGRGFLQVELPTGEFAYTRDGALQRNNQGELVTIDGYLISPVVTIPDDATSISINANGQVEVTIDGQIQPNQIGQLDMINFINPAGLEAVGNNLYRETPASGIPVIGIAGEEGFGTILQGFLEQSNVNAVTEITNLIVAQRAYEMNTKVITASDEMLQSLNQSA